MTARLWLRLLTAALTCVSATSTAYAGDPELPPWLEYAGPEAEVHGGLTCGLTAWRDPREQPGYVQGLLTAGPFVAGGASAVVIECIVSVNNDVADDMDQRFTSTTEGQVGVFTPRLARITATTGQPVFLCTHVTVYHNREPYFRQYDADRDPRNGAQCRKSADPDAAADVYVSPSAPEDEWCATVYRLPSPPLPFDHHEACTVWWPF